MTEQEMCNRMKEIDKERDMLREEREGYEKYFSDKRLKEQLNNRKQYIGKCFISKNELTNEQKQIKAFKVLRILENPNESYAECIVLIDGYDSNYWNVKAIKNQVIGLWVHNKLRLMSSKLDSKVVDFYKVIDYYREISQEEFETLYREYKNDLEDKVYR